MATRTRHEQISQRFLDHAEAEFQKGDMLQASEKAWGAVAHYVKSVARTNDWPNTSHRDIADNAGRLIRRTSDPKGNKRKFGSMNDLHSNFYEEDLGRDEVEDGIRNARELIEAMREVEPRQPE